MHRSSSIARSRRWTALATAAATTAAAVVFAGISPAEATPGNGYHVTTVPVGGTPHALAVDPSIHQVFVTDANEKEFDSNDGKVYVIDSVSNTVTATLAVGGTPVAVAVDPGTHKAYVTDLTGSVAVISTDPDTGTHTVKHVPVGSFPTEVAVDPGTHKAYVLNSDSVSVIGTDPVTGEDTVSATLPFVGSVLVPAAGLAVDPGTHKAYVANVSEMLVISTDPDTGEDTVTGRMDLTPRATGLAVNPVTHAAYAVSDDGTMWVYGTNPATGADEVTESNIWLEGVSPTAVTVNAATNTLYVTSSIDDKVAVFDGATNRVTATVAVGDAPLAAQVDEATNTVYVPNLHSNTVSAIDGATNDVATVGVGGSPAALALNPDTGAVYVANYDDGTLSVVTGTSTVTTVTVSPAPTAGTAVTLTAAVIPNPAGGTVEFTDGATPITDCTAQPIDPTTGSATCTLTFPSSGPRTIVADYSGHAGYHASTASPLALTVAPAPAPPAPSAPSTPVVSRIAGADRYATATAASAARFADGAADAVILASGESYPDALAGVPLAKAKHAPLLLTTGANLTNVTRAEIRRVLPAGHTVYVLGGTGAISPSVATELTSLGYVVDRLGGQDRNATAIKVAGELGNRATVLLASGRDYADALAAGPAAAATGGVVLFTNGATLAPATIAYLAAHQGTVYAVGGPAAAAAPGAFPLAGKDRYATATAVAARFFPAPTHAGVASGTAFADALSGGALVAADGGPLLLANTGRTDAATDYLSRVRASVTDCMVLGGTGAVPTQVSDALAAALRP